MISEITSFDVDVSEEISALIETLLITEQRLDELTAGKVDMVAGRDGTTFLLRRAQEQLRHIEAGKQAGILNALSAHIALLDNQGNIVSVNEAWRRFADANVLHAPGHGVGLNYLVICDRARGAYSSEAHQVADGIRAVLEGREKSFSIEYPCHSPTEQRWFLLTVTPLVEDHLNGAVVMHLNITERMQAQLALQASQKRLRDLIDGVGPNMFVGLLTPQGTMIECNRPALAAAGLNPEDVLGLPFEETYWFAHSLEVQRRLREAIMRATRGEASRYDLQIQGTGDDFVDVDFSLQPLLDEAGKVIFLIPSASVITERKRAEERFRLSEERLRAALSASRTGTFRWDFHTDELVWDESLDALFGIPQGKAIRSLETFIATIHPDDRTSVIERCERCAQDGADFDAEFRVLWPDGSIHWLHDKGKTFFDADGQPSYMTGACVDITNRKLAETTLRESDEKFRQLADNITDVFWITSPNFEIMEYVSPGYEQIWGRSAESLYAHPHQWVESILPEEREQAFAVFATLMGSAPEVSVEYRIDRPDGTVRWIHDRGFQVRNAAGELVRLTGIASDITEQKKLEAQLRQAHKMEAIGTLAGGIAHDFNNILGAIIGYSELARRSIHSDMPAHAHLEQVLIASNRARDLVRQILTFSRQDDLEQDALELQTLIEESLTLLRVSLPSTVEIHQNIDIATPSLFGDKIQIQQAIMNLLDNAGQAMKERGGVLDVSLTRVDVDRDFASVHPELQEGPHVCLQVSDSGSGMDRETQEHIFEPFFTTKAPGEGTGLGLAVVHGVINNHRGAIVVSSEIGVGTTFSIYLPVYHHGPTPAINTSDPVPRGNGEHILFVDDEQPLVSLGRSMLEDLGYRVTTRTDGVEALAAFRLHPEDFDLVITDQRMPHMDGAALTTALLKIRPALPVILATGYSTAMNHEKAKAIGARELLFKPNTMQSLAEAIQRALGGSRKE